MSSLPLDVLEPARRVYHTGTPTALHIPLHGGVGIRSSVSRSTIGGVVTGRGGRLYLSMARHAVDKVGSTATLYPIQGNTPVARVDPKTTIRKSGIDIALVEPLVPVSFEILGVGIPTGHTAPRTGMMVIMLGLTSVSAGIIATPPSNYNIKGELRNTFWIKPNGSSFGKAGDSGSWVIEQTTRKVVGIFYGGAPIQGKSWGAAHNVDHVATQLGISFAGRPGAFNPNGTPATPSAPAPASGGGGTSPTQPQLDNPLMALIQAIIDFINGFITGFTK